MPLLCQKCTCFGHSTTPCSISQTWKPVAKDQPHPEPVNDTMNGKGVAFRREGNLSSEDAISTAETHITRKERSVKHFTEDRELLSDLPGSRKPARQPAHHAVSGEEIHITMHEASELHCVKLGNLVS